MSYLSTFNNHFAEFLEDVASVFPEDAEIKTAQTALTAIRKANPKLIVKIWRTVIAAKYRSEIERGDIHFFIDKDYKGDIFSRSSDKIMQAIERLREPVRNMGKENQEKAMKYIQNLTQLSDLCPE